MIAALPGLIAGAIHVWAGPDHLAAIAPIALRQKKRPWLEGIRWGIGHSAGVGLVGVLSLLLREVVPTELISAWGERLVGVMLIGIGLWALNRALRHRVHAHQHAHDGDEGEAHVHYHAHAKATGHEKPKAHIHQHAAMGIGVLHGLAGSSHFLGVLPALMLPTTTQAVLYLTAFAVGTVLSMAFFSTVMGFLGTRFALTSEKAYRGLMSLCATAALVVGAFWLTL